MTHLLVLLDTECARFRGAPHLIELAAMRIEDGRVVDSWDALVRADVPVDEESRAVHGLGDEDLANGAPGTEVLERFARFAQGAWLVAHGARADARTLGFAYQRARVTPPRARWLDTQALARVYLPTAPSYGLLDLARRLDVADRQAHRALADARLCHGVLEALLANRGGWANFVPSAAPSAARPRPQIAPPRTPGLARRHRPLLQACRERTPLWMRFASSPASELLDPLQIYSHRGQAYLEARCPNSGAFRAEPVDSLQLVATA